MEDVKIDVRIKLSALWVAAMFCYLYADVLGLFVPGSLEKLIAGEVGGMQINQLFLFASAIFMVPPIVMIFLSLTLQDPVNRWANIIVPIVFLSVNLIGLPTYSAYDQFLIIVGLGLNALTVWYA